MVPWRSLGDGGPDPREMGLGDMQFGVLLFGVLFEVLVTVRAHFARLTVG